MIKPFALAALSLWVTASLAQSTTVQLSVTGPALTLTVPYFEYTHSGTRQAYSASFGSNVLALDQFALDTASVRTTALLTGANQAPQLTAGTTGFRLSMPYLEFSSGGRTRAFSASLVSANLSSFAIDLASVREVPLQTTLAKPATVTVSASNTQTVAGQALGSSSQLAVSWTAPTGYAIDHYLVTATESGSVTQVSVTTASTATSATLTPLKAGTAYTVTVKACADAACPSAGTSDAAAGTTPAEHWQLQGTGNTVATLTKPVSDGNARLSATRFGAEAGPVANTVQFYYGPMGITGQSVATSGVVSATQPSSYLTGFTSFASTSGVRSPTSATQGIKSIMTGQGVPLSAAMGGKVRLFFESNDTDGKTRIYSVDSVDGYVGRDFNLGAATTCTTSADYSATGNCPATTVLGVAGDTVNPTQKISAARQNKVAWPTLTDWRWNGEVGTFMVFTIDRVTGCTTASHNHGYAQWDGSRFVPQYDAAGCPKAFMSAQAALPMHIGGARYKMYFGDPSVTTGKPTGATLPFVGPKKLIYGDGALTGPAASVEFEDWESTTAGRNVVFLWPNGDTLNDTAEGFIDDFHFLTPTGSLDTQVLYLSITDGTVAPFAATAVLLNP